MAELNIENKSNNMYYFSTKYHLLIVEVSDVIDLIESFILTQKDIFDLVKA